MENERDPVFGGAPFSRKRRDETRRRDVSSSRALLRSERLFLRVVVVSVPLCLLCLLLFLFVSKKECAQPAKERERETRARECSNQRRRVNLERKRRDVRVFSRRWSMRCVVLRHRRAPAVCFFREKDQPTRAKEKEETKESSRSSCAYIYITRGKRNRCVVCIVRARVVRVFFGNEGR